MMQWGTGTQRRRWLPALALAAWAGTALAVPVTSLTVAGAVDRSATFALSDLRMLPAQTTSVTPVVWALLE